MLKPGKLYVVCWDSSCSLLKQSGNQDRILLREGDILLVLDSFIVSKDDAANYTNWQPNRYMAIQAIYKEKVITFVVFANSFSSFLKLAEQYFDLLNDV